MKTFNRFVVPSLVAIVILSACVDVTPTSTPDVEFTPTPADEYTPIDLQAGYGLRGPWF